MEGRDMDWFFVGAAAVGFGLLAVGGVLALATGWLAPWLRGRVVRPDLWGYGTVSLAAGLATVMSFKMAVDSEIVLDTLFVLAMALVILGGLLQRRSLRRPTDQ
ncbi:hypothetical protein CP978_11290 [Streptomyces nodosus]|uniref:Uncharacterized protein n=2 Tax=Streptomyces nodosus TaxID=40318 RepID=A0A5P2W086_9ACTN|nr:hypothetical protein CP978_11290 [Streptomyces nodosus]